MYIICLYGTEIVKYFGYYSYYAMDKSEESLLSIA